MYDAIKILFWGSSILVVYPYVIYPLILKVSNAFFRKPVDRKEFYPVVTVIIPAFNEAEFIGATVENKLEQDYPKEKIDIIVVSDESTDGTDEIVNKFTHEHPVQLIRQVPRRGKAAGLNLAIKQAKGEIIIFSDANSIFDRDAIRKIVENYSDPSVGYVTGNLTYLVESEGVAQRGSDAYMKFENLLREIETQFGSVIGVNGGVDSIRKELYVDIPQDQITDFVLPLHVIEQGKRVVYDERAGSCEAPNVDASSEFRMRVRVALRALRGLVYMRALFNPVRHARTSFCLVSHKLIRYFAPWFMIFALVSNVFLYKHDLYMGLLIVQVLFYLLALIGITKVSVPGLGKFTKVPSYFVLSNAAFFVAIIKLFKGESMAMWKPRQG